MKIINGIGTDYAIQNDGKKIIRKRVIEMNALNASATLTINFGPAFLKEYLLMIYEPVARCFDDCDRYRETSKLAKECGNYGGLFRLCVEFLKRYPDNVFANFDLLEVYVRRGDVEKACAIVEKLCERYPSDEGFLRAQADLIRNEACAR